ncbi:dephospho-CoA kinase [Fulvivirga sedimenti]|uniref:Dephospho-CoA kinase n=1 Tax=Fulvivirga sedimenti TaxID=2879465 RepID=A0A9X1L178_9BACT|nr:dephospho-CoA kinase [Fulvivirga sedimenti]
MKQIGITGGIGSGKSLVARIFNCLGIPVYDADNRAKWITNHDPAIIEKVKSLLGEFAYRDGQLDRNRVSSQVFGKPELLENLNSIIHPAVGEDYKKWVLQQNTSYVLKEAALLFESGSFRQLDGIIHVSAPMDLRIKRTLERDKQRGREQIEAIIARQMNDDERLAKSDFEIINDGHTLVIPQVLKLHAMLSQL